MSKAIISLGSNIGNTKDYLNQAIEKLEEFSSLIKKSNFYKTEPYGNKDQDWFSNAAATIETNLDPHQLLEHCQKIEQDLGRERKEKWGPRTIDLDILFYNNEVIKTKDLIIPHPQITKRNFVLTCLIEIEPNFVHPVENKTITQLHNELKTTDKVIILD